MKTFIIAEVGVNHNGSLNMAYKLVDAALAAEADAVKFQTFQADLLVTKDASQADYQAKNLGKECTQYEMLKTLELSYQDFIELEKYCCQKGIIFLSTAFESTSLNFLCSEFNLPYLKIPSGELTNLPFLLEHARTKKKLILSTGMATLDEIKSALEVIAFGLTAKLDETPSPKAFRESYKSKAGQIALKEGVTVLHCTTQYPTPLESVNLQAMKTISEKFSVKVGYSDHTAGLDVASLAVAAGATVIEKHFTLNKSLEGPDHKASLEPQELNEMVKRIRFTEKILGKENKTPCEEEIKNIELVRKSLVATRDIQKDEIFSLQNISTSRPGSGVEPSRFWDFLGKPSPVKYTKGELIKDL